MPTDIRRMSREDLDRMNEAARVWRARLAPVIAQEPAPEKGISPQLASDQFLLFEAETPYKDS
jgi:hypothetical protein